MHSNNAQVHVQIPTTYYSLGAVTMAGSMGFTSASHHSINHAASNTTTGIYPYHSGTGPFQSSQPYHTPSQLEYHGHQQQHSHIKPIEQVDIYQTPHQSLDSELMNPMLNRQLNNANNYHAPPPHSHQYSYYHNKQSTLHHQTESSEQLRSNASTPTPTLASTLSTVSSASTPSLSSNATTLPNGHDYYNRQTSPTVTSASPEQLTIGSLPSPLTWTDSNGSPMDQDLSSQQAQQQQQVTSPIKREHSSFSANSSPKTDRASYYSTQQLYTSQDQPQQVWVASIADDIHTQQEFLNQERQQHHQRSYSQSSKGYHSPQASVVSQQSTLPAISGLPLLSPTNMFQPDSQPSSYPMGMHDTPTVMSHDYGRVMSSVAVDDGSHYNSMAHKKNRTSSVGSQCDYDGRPRAGSVNSTTSSIASSCAISSLATTFGSTVIGSSFPAQLMEENEEEEEDSDSPTTIQMRPRNNSAPRRATAVRAFTCSVIGCTKAYTQLHNLKSHERTGHTPVIKLKPFTCIVGDCKKAFSQRKSLALHIKAAHAEFKFKPFKCSQPGCTKSYTQLHNLRTHEKTVHLVDLSRKRIKNPSNTTTHCMTSSGQGLATPAGFGLDTTKHHGQQMGYQQHGGHMDGGAHSGLGLAYDPIDMASLSHHGDGGAYHYQPRQHEQPEPQQQHHHHHQQQQQYARLPHMSALPMYDHRA